MADSERKENVLMVLLFSCAVPRAYVGLQHFSFSSRVHVWVCGSASPSSPVFFWFTSVFSIHPFTSFLFYIYKFLFDLQHSLFRVKTFLFFIFVCTAPSLSLYLPLSHTLSLLSATVLVFPSLFVFPLLSSLFYSRFVGRYRSSHFFLLSLSLLCTHHRIFFIPSLFVRCYVTDQHSVLILPRRFRTLCFSFFFQTDAPDDGTELEYVSVKQRKRRKG